MGDYKCFSRKYKPVVKILELGCIKLFKRWAHENQITVTLSRIETTLGAIKPESEFAGDCAISRKIDF